MADEQDNKKKYLNLLKQSFGPSLIIFALLAIGAGLAVYHFEGSSSYDRAIADALELLAFIAPRIGAAVIIAAFLQILIPREVISRLIGEKAGIKSVFMATVAGSLTPGGPLTSFPVVIALYAAGANKGALVAYITSWAMIGIQRIIVWELPLLGPDITFIRVSASMLLPIIAGILALYIPIRITLTKPPEFK
ncbi:MAG: permease [Pseudomonadota bacterium]|nr:permease [Pseudomonadota bacterium]